MRVCSGENKIVTMKGVLFYAPSWGVKDDKSNFYIDLFELERAPIIAANDRKREATK